MSPLFCLENLVSQTVKQARVWEETLTPPEEVRKNKSARAAWISDPSTKWRCYSLVEGLNPHLRVARGRGSVEGNPPYRLHGLIGDYDSPISEDQMLESVRKSVLPPALAERTLSGNWRLIWFFEEPLILANAEFASLVLQEAVQVIEHVLPRFDRNACIRPTQYFTTSGDWRVLDANAKIDRDTVLGWAFAAAQKLKTKDLDGVELPLGEIERKLREKYPAFSKWTGPFVEGARGPTFWIPESQSPNSAVVTTKGFITFSAHASRGFYSWADLLGPEEVAKWSAELTGAQVRDIYWDRRYYWVLNSLGHWTPYDRVDIQRWLRTARGVSPKVDKAGVSAIDRALTYIQEHQAVEIAAPFVFYPPGPQILNGRRVLNISTKTPMQPAAELTEWGPTGKFPWLSAFLEGLLQREHMQLELWLAWTKRAYSSYLERAPVAGQVLFLIGPPGVGKTLMSRAILGELFGGFAEAGPYLLGEDSFNAELFASGLWCVDDNSASTDLSKIRRWTSALKRIAANMSFRYNEKFRTASVVDWSGRLVITCNADAESSRLLPDLSASVRDKLIILSAHQHNVPFPPAPKLRQVIKTELPYFARWLLDWTPPETVMGDARFGTRAFIHPSLVALTEISSVLAGYRALVTNWLKVQHGQTWSGTAEDMLMLCLSDPAYSKLLKNITITHWRRILESLVEEGIPGWIIARKGVILEFKKAPQEESNP